MIVVGRALCIQLHIFLSLILKVRCIVFAVKYFINLSIKSGKKMSAHRAMEGIFSYDKYFKSNLYVSRNVPIYAVQTSHIFRVCVNVVCDFFPWFHPVPADVHATCKYSNGGYSIDVVWKKLEGVWTEVEVKVNGQNHTLSANEGEQIKIPGFQPAKTYEVSISSVVNVSGTVRRSPPYVFDCYTDPRGKSQ